MFADEVAAGRLDHLVGLDEPEAAVDFRDDPGHGRLAGTGRTGEGEVQTARGGVEATVGADLGQRGGRLEFGDLLLDRVEADLVGQFTLGLGHHVRHLGTFGGVADQRVGEIGHRVGVPRVAPLGDGVGGGDDQSEIRRLQRLPGR